MISYSLLQKRIFLGLLALFLNQGLQAQDASEEAFKGIEAIVHKTYIHTNAKDARLSIYKESHFDTNQVLIEQKRFHYEPVDTGLHINKVYMYSYQPESRLGEYSTLRTAYPKTLEEGNLLQRTEFRSYDHKQKRSWVKQYNAEGKLRKESRYDYDSLGNMTKAYIKDLKFSPPSVHIDEVSRDAKGQMLHWESHDEDELGRKKVRDTRWSYRFDTLIEIQEGYIYNNWTEIVNRYNKRAELQRVTVSNGIYISGRKPKIDDLIVTKYKNGKAQSQTVKRLGKKVSTTKYKYNENAVTESYQEGKEKKITRRVKNYDEQNRITEELLEENAKILSKKSYFYNEDMLTLRREISFRSNGDEWKTEFVFERANYPAKRSFYINDKLQQEDVYEYILYPEKEAAPEEEQD